MTAKRMMTIVASVGVVALLSYTGLVWWQLDAFDRRVGEHRYVSSLLYDFELQVEKHFLKREVQLTAGINLDAPVPEHTSVTNPVVVFKGSLTPGLHPKLTLTPVRIDDPQAEIFFKSNPQLEMRFGIDMMPKVFKMQWNKASVGEEVLGDGSIRADIAVDHDTQSVETLSVSGRMSRSETTSENGRLLLGDKYFSINYEKSPPKISFVFDTEGDQLGQIVALNATGPQHYEIQTYSTTSAPNDQSENHTDFDISIKKLNLQADQLPSIDVELKGVISTPPEIWLPCELSRLSFGEAVVTVPGICPSPDKKVPGNFSLNGVHGQIERFSVASDKLNLSFKGGFEFSPNLAASFDMEACIGDFIDKPTLTMQESITNQVLAALQTLQNQGAVQKTQDGRYTSKIEVKLSEDGVLELTGNGVSLLNVGEPFDANIDPMQSGNDADYSVIFEVTQGSVTDEKLNAEVIVPFKQASSKLEGIHLISTERDSSGRYLFHFSLENGFDPNKAFDAIDQLLTKIASTKPEGVEITFIY